MFHQRSSDPNLRAEIGLHPPLKKNQTNCDRADRQAGRQPGRETGVGGWMDTSVSICILMRHHSNYIYDISNEV